MFKVVRAETVLTIEGSAGEIAQIALHLGLDGDNYELHVPLDELDDAQIEWVENKLDINGLHPMMSLILTIVEGAI